MRPYLGFLISVVLALVLALVTVALAPNIKIEAERDSLAEARDKLDSYPFTPLVSELRVFAASWKKWVDEIDSASKKGSPNKAMVESNAPIFRKGKDKVETRIYMVASSTVAAPLLFWLVVLIGAKVYPRVEHVRYIAGRLALILLGGVVVAIALPCVVCEDWTGLAFSTPTILGAIVGWVNRPK